MKSAEGKLEQTASSSRDENLQTMVRLILETMVAFGKPYGQNYTAQFLTADRYLMLRQPTHRSIETYGKLGHRNLEDVVSMMHYLADEGLIIAKEPDFMTMEVGEAGLQWLAQPQEVSASWQRVRFSPLEKYLRSALRETRRDLADRMEIKPWDVMTDYIMDRIVLNKPLDLDTLSRLPGFNTLKCERFGVAIVKCVQDVLEHFDDYVRASLLARVKRGSYPRVKSLFLLNLTLPEIAQQCGLAMSTVCGYLRDLHDANHVDLIPWIERNINSKSLFKGVEYFERVRKPGLKEAHLTLGLDYNTLLFCSLYAKDKRMQQKEAQLLAS
jgi:hypothetical protein